MTTAAYNKGPEGPDWLKQASVPWGRKKITEQTATVIGYNNSPEGPDWLKQASAPSFSSDIMAAKGLKGG